MVTTSSANSGQRGSVTDRKFGKGLPVGIEIEDFSGCAGPAGVTVKIAANAVTTTIVRMMTTMTIAGLSSGRVMRRNPAIRGAIEPGRLL